MEKVNFSNVRVRIAPSPTGYVHIGNLRTILYNYLFARHQNGKFIIRIEDTDQSRLVPGALENLLRVLAWVGIEADEGPELKNNKITQKGDLGPYIQSERLKIYQEQIQHLLDKNKAYYCFCSKERLDDLRVKQKADKLPPKYDGFCKNLDKDEIKTLLAQKTPHVIRFRMPENKEVVFEDLIRGKITVNTKDLDDYVLIKADGFPTYHFASVVDDHLMKITHIMRGDEWIASTPKHVLLYDAFGWQMPEFAHLPQLLNKQKKKLSKRDGDTSVHDFIQAGYLKDALINFLALLGWNAGTEQEIYTLNELIKQFSLDNVHKTHAVFDVEKLDWINGMYLRKMSIDNFYEIAIPYLTAANLLTENKDKVIINETGEKVKPSYIKNILELEQTRIKKLVELPEAVSYFFQKDLDFEPNKLIWKKSDQTKTLENLKLLEDTLKTIAEEDFKIEKIEKAVFALIENQSLDNGSILWPMRFSLTGRDKSPGPFETAAALGKDKTLTRINSAITKLL